MDSNHHAARVRRQLEQSLDVKREQGWLESIIAETKDPTYKWRYP